MLLLVRSNPEETTLSQTQLQHSIGLALQHRVYCHLTTCADGLPSFNRPLPRRLQI